jgi:cyclopropane fatty-acyl-phospholipid synthase-like methyltransferase
MGNIYNEQYYRYKCGSVSYENQKVWVEFFSGIAKKIVQDFNPRTLLDVGCAMGYLVSALRDLGVDAYGIDISEYAISRVREDIKPYCRALSALDPLPEEFPKVYDMVTNIEVAEHLSQEEGKRLISILCNYSDCIIFSSTPNDYDEKTHINVQKNEYWAKIFAQNGFYNHLDYDLNYLAPQAIYFSKEQKSIPQIVEDYERHLRILKKSNTLGLKRIEQLEQQLQMKIEQLEQQKEQLQQQKEQQDNYVRLFNAQWEQCEREGQLIQRQSEELMKVLESTRSDLQLLKSETVRYKDDLDKILNSTSWRMTKPFRLLFSRFKYK